MRRICLLMVFLLVLMSGCSSSDKEYPSKGKVTPAPKIEDMYLPSTPGTMIFSDVSGLVQIDYSNMQEGYICAKRLTAGDEVIKLAITKGEEDYHYDITSGEYQSFPLQMGSGAYQFRILKQLQGDQYAVMESMNVDVSLVNELIPFLYPSQIVNYTPDSKAVAKAYQLTKHDKTELSRIYHIYNYVITHIKYDDKKVEEVEGKFVLPIVDETLASNKGICFDYTALVTTMLRSHQIPTRLITGYTSKEYHSWVEVYVEGKGWINPQVYFKDKIWTRMDPTFAAQGEEYDGEYQERYVY